jgi:hypothetical protein
MGFRVSVGGGYTFIHRLIELTDEQMRNLDDELPKLLLKFGVVVS